MAELGLLLPSLLYGAMPEMPRRDEGGGPAAPRTLDRAFQDVSLVALLVGREGGSPGSPTGPVVDATVLFLLLRASNSEVALESDVVGRPSLVVLLVG